MVFNSLIVLFAYKYYKNVVIYLCRSTLGLIGNNLQKSVQVLNFAAQVGPEKYSERQTASTFKIIPKKHMPHIFVIVILKKLFKNINLTINLSTSAFRNVQCSLGHTLVSMGG